MYKIIVLENYEIKKDDYEHAYTLADTLWKNNKYIYYFSFRPHSTIRRSANSFGINVGLYINNTWLKFSVINWNYKSSVAGQVIRCVCPINNTVIYISQAILIANYILQFL